MAGRLRAKFEVYNSGTKDLSRFNDTTDLIKQYDSLYSKFLHDANAWRLVGILSVLLLAASIGVLFYTVRLPREKLVVVSVNDIGQASYIGYTTGVPFNEFSKRESCIENVLDTFIKNTYQVTTDPEYMYECFSLCTYYLEAEKRKAYINEINTTDPFSEVNKLKRNADIESIIKVSENTYQVDFKTRSSNLSNNYVLGNTYRGIFSIVCLNEDQYKNLTEKERRKNPLGIYITDYTIVELKGN